MSSSFRCLIDSQEFSSLSGMGHSLAIAIFFYYFSQLAGDVTREINMNKMKKIINLFAFCTTITNGNDKLRHGFLPFLGMGTDFSRRVFLQIPQHLIGLVPGFLFRNISFKKYHLRRNSRSGDRRTKRAPFHRK